MNEGLLEAGGVLPVGTDVTAAEGDGIRCDVVLARRYRHPGLGDRPVVRLVGERIGAGEDAALACFGFSGPERVAPVGVGQRRNLRFPESVLVDDPEHAAEALGVVPDLRRITKLAQQKPGLARDAMNKLVARYSQTLPHFLPGIYEYLARVFIEVGADTLASSTFDSARAAERTHALPVDEVARRDAYLEFALAGAVSAKTLTAYARDLAKDHAPEKAYAEFRELCVRRTLGGLSPWTDLLKVLMRLAKAAGLDLTAEEDALTTTLLDAPAFGSSAPKVLAGFWPAIKRIGATSPAALAKLAWLFPSGEHSDEFRAGWVDLLAEIGVIEALAAGQLGTEQDAAARWLNRLIEYTNRMPKASARLLEVVAGLAGTIRAAGTPVEISRARNVDVEVIDTLLASGVAVTGRFTVSLDDWRKRTRRRDLSALAGHPEHRQKLVDAVRSSVIHGIDAFGDTPAVAEIVDQWLTEQFQALEFAGLVEMSKVIGALSGATRPGSFDQRPEQHATLAATDPAGALANCLRGGLLDEFGWPALEEAVTRLGDRVRYSNAWPNLVVSNDTTALVVGRDKIIAEYSLRGSGTEGITALLAAEHDLLVERSDPHGSGYRAAWISSPADHFRTNLPASMPPGALPVPGGGRTDGGRALMPGDRTFTGSSAARVFSDGTGYWRMRLSKERNWIERFDPRTGEAQDETLPAFLADRPADVDQAASLCGRACSLAPLVTGSDRVESVLAGSDPAVDSVLGSRDGLVGFRVWVVDESTSWPGVVAESIDGRRFTGFLPQVPEGLLAIPGSPVPRPVLGGDRHSHSGSRVQLMDPTGTFLLASRSAGEPDWYDRQHGLNAPSIAYLPTPQYWHNLSVRESGGSAALRGISLETARRLVDAAVADLQAWDARADRDSANRQPAELPATTAALADLLPEITHPGLRTGVLEALRFAGKVQREMTSLVVTRAPGAAQALAGAAESGATSAKEFAGKLVSKAITGLSGSAGYGYYYGAPVGTSLSSTLGYLSGRRAELPKQAARSSLRWPALLARPGALALRAVSPAIDEDQRADLLSLLDLWAEGLTAGADQYQIGWSDQHEAHQDHELGGFETSAGRYAHLQFDWNGCCVIAQPGVTPPLAGPRLAAWPAARLDAGWLTRFTALARERGPVPEHPEVVAALAERTGLTAPEAALLWATLPNIDTNSSNFLSTAVRTRLGLKSTEAQIARQSLARIPGEQRLAILEAAVPDDPADLWRPLGTGGADDSGVVARLGAAFCSVVGRAVELPPAAVAEARIAEGSLPRLEMLRTVVQPSRIPELARTPRYRIPRRDGSITWDGPTLSGELLVELSRYLAWGATALPVGDPVRAGMPATLAQIKQRLDDPRQLLPLGKIYIGGHSADPLLGFGDVEFRSPAGSADPEPGTSRDAGGFVAILSGYYISVLVRPGQLEPGPLHDMIASRISNRGTLAALLSLRSAGYAALAARVTDTPVPPGGYEANPVLAVPDLVAEVAAAAGLGTDAAALYLQLLALTAPTDRAVRLWNGWKPVRHKAAIAELIEQKLVLEAQRARAGRTVFLPGGWADAAAPDLPVESWKLALYGCEVVDGKVRAPLGRVLPPRPVHELFAAAWRRVQEGDRP